MILDRVWMLVNKKSEPPSVIYMAAGSARDVWDMVIELEIMGTGVTKEMLKAEGYRATRVAICTTPT